MQGGWVCRRYKTGFVWQDLRDDDLITPITDNEYVLKGSEIHSGSYLLLLRFSVEWILVFFFCWSVAILVRLSESMV